MVILATSGNLLCGPRDLHQLERPILAQFPWSEIQPQSRSGSRLRINNKR